MTADHRDGVLDSVKRGELLLQMAVERHLAGNETAGRYCGSVLPDCRDGCFVDACIAMQAEIVVGGKIVQPAAIDPDAAVFALVVQTKIRVGQTCPSKGAAQSFLPLEI